MSSPLLARTDAGGRPDAGGPDASSREGATGRREGRRRPERGSSAHSPGAAPSDLGSVKAELATEGFAVLRRAASPRAVQAANRLLNLAIRRHGLTAEEIARCQGTTFFPHLRWEPEVWGVLPPAAAELLGWAEGDDWAEPQLLLRFPDERGRWPLEPHIDQPPPWAPERRYRGIVGVALTSAGARDGAPCVWPGSHQGRPSSPRSVRLAPGDALLMHPELAHCGTLNLGGSVRAAIYFRLLGG